MSDTFSVRDRQKIMRLVHSKNTSPELVVRSTLHREGFRFRLHSKKLPGTPDIVLHKYQTVALVQGCFWHQHKECKNAARPKSNKKYWNQKLDRNLQRDKNNIKKLKKLGWKVLVIWECQINRSDDWFDNFARLKNLT